MFIIRDSKTGSRYAEIAKTFLTYDRKSDHSVAMQTRFMNWLPRSDPKLRSFANCTDGNYDENADELDTE